MRKPIHEIPRNLFADPKRVVPHPLPASLVRCVEDAAKQCADMDRDSAARAAAFRKFNREIPLHDGYSVRTESRVSHDYILTNADGRIIGGYLGPTSFVQPSFRGQGIATAAILALWNDEYCVRYGGFAIFSEEGYRVRVRAHRKAVEAALERGDEIPELVMRDYSDLESRNAPTMAAGV